MKVFIVSYDLGSPENSSDYEELKKYLKSFDNWAKPLQSVWFIISNKSVSTVRDEIRTLTDSNDKILVMDVTEDNWATDRISENVTDWMKDNI